MRKVISFFGFVLTAFVLSFALYAEFPQARVVQVPVAIESPSPQIPENTLQQGEEKTVIVHVHVLKTGEVKSVKIHASGGDILDQASIIAIKQWRFAPALNQKGEAIPAILELPIHYHRPIEKEDDLSHVAPSHGHSHEQSDLVNEEVLDQELLLEQPILDHRNEEFSTSVHEHEGMKGQSSASDFKIEIGELAKVPRQSAAELLNLAPGMTVINHGGKGHASSLYIRGFDAGEGKDFALSVEGVPLNEVSHPHGHGYANTNFIIPELVSRLDVKEGSFHASQGDFAIAGSGDYRLAAPKKGITIGAEYGEYNQMRLFSIIAPASSPHNYAAFQLQKGDGFGSSRDYLNGSLTLSFETLVFENVKIHSLAILSAGRFSSAGILREQDVYARSLDCANTPAAQFYCSYDSSQGGNNTRALAAVELSFPIWKGHFKNTLFTDIKSSTIVENYSGFAQGKAAFEADPQGDAVRLFAEGLRLGARGRLLQRFVMPQGYLKSEVGYFSQFQNVNSLAERLRFKQIIPYKEDFNVDVQMFELSPYTHLSYIPFSFLRFQGGLRASMFQANVGDHHKNVEDRNGVRLAHQNSVSSGLVWMPRGSMAVELVEGLEGSFSIGTGARSSDPVALSDGESAPFTQVISGESGLQYEWTHTQNLKLQSRLVAFYAHVGNDFLFDPAVGRNTPVGASERFGAFVQARMSWKQRLDFNANFSFSRSYNTQKNKYLDYQNWTRENRLAFIPETMARFDGIYHQKIRILEQSLRLSFAMGTTFIGPKPLPYQLQSQMLLIVDTSLRLAWRNLHFVLAAKNILNTRYRQVEYFHVSHFKDSSEILSRVPARHFAAGSPRMVTLGVEYSFDPEAIFGG